VRAVLALDQGTSSSRTIVFDERARICGFAQREFEQHFPRPGWVEHDPRDLWESQIATAADALRQAGAAAAGVAAIGVTNQRETTLLWDRSTGEPLHNAIVWQDRRTAAMCETLRGKGYGALVAARTGLVLDPYFSATKLAWMLENIPDARRRAERGELAFGTVDTWLIWNLTRGARHVTDVTNASRTMLFDIHEMRWSEDLLGIFGIPRALLPDVLPCAADFGTADAALFGSALPICGAAGDQQAALAGQAGFSAGVLKNTYGTGSFAMLHTGSHATQSKRGLLTTIAHAFSLNAPSYALEGSVFVTGAAVSWLRDNLKIIERARDIEALASSVPDTGGVAFVPAFTGLGAPYWDANARGSITGITRGTGRAHIARAALEAIAFQCADVIEAMQADSGVALQELRADGGGSTNALTMQLQADALGAAVVVPEIAETTALGAAFLAGLQSGVWPDVDTVMRLWRERARYVPQIGAQERERALQRWHRAVERSRE
jgi:glycerol kinase